MGEFFYLSLFVGILDLKIGIGMTGNHFPLIIFFGPRHSFRTDASSFQLCQTTAYTSFFSLSFSLSLLFPSPLVRALLCFECTFIAADSGIFVESSANISAKTDKPYVTADSFKNSVKNMYAPVKKLL